LNVSNIGNMPIFLCPLDSHAFDHIDIPGPIHALGQDTRRKHPWTNTRTYAKSGKLGSLWTWPKFQKIEIISPSDNY
jgi:hypothetical protein